MKRKGEKKTTKKKQTFEEKRTDTKRDRRNAK